MYQRPMFRGFHSTLLGVNLTFSVIEPSLIQILYVQNHWITVEAAVTTSLVIVYDSVHYSSDISASKPVIKLQIQRTQFQVGSSDCGLFSIAYATQLAYGNNPACYRYKQEMLRSHLVKGLCSNNLLPFPSTEVSALKPIKEFCVGRSKGKS